MSKGRLWASAFIIAVGVLPSLDGAAATSDLSARIIDLPQLDLNGALTYVARLYNVELVYESDLVKGLPAPRLGGYKTAREALSDILRPSGLVLVENLPGSFLITAPIQPASEASGPAANHPEPSLPEPPLSEVVVVGTHIRNEFPIGSVITVYDMSDLQSLGGITLENLGRSMTSNFSGADSLATLNTNGGAGNLRQGAASNVFGGAGFNLLGLGPGATLTLLNGHRLAPAGLDGSITDMSLIPLSAVDHVEVLTDGASAVYGSDAVAGVVNIVTRTALDGAESVVRYGDSSDGGGSRTTAAQLAGHSWSSGSVLADFEYTDQHGLDASRRDWVPPQSSRFSLIPENISRSIFLTGHQDLNDRSSLSATALYTSRTFSSSGVTVNADGAAPGVEAARGAVSQTTGTVSLDTALSKTWTGTTSIDYSSTHQNRYGYLFAGLDRAPTDYLAADFSLANIDVSASGQIIGGALVSTGVSLRYETFSGLYPSVNPLPLISEHRFVASVYGELSLPIIDSSRSTRWAQSIDLSLAYRLDHYSQIGTDPKPKLGFAWLILPGYKFKATYGRSYEAPLLSQVFAPTTSYTTPFVGLPNGGDALVVEGGSRRLAPQKSTSVTAGFDIAPTALRGFKTSFSYFYTRFNDRIQSQNIEAKSIADQSLLIAHSLYIDSPAEAAPYYDIPGFQGDNGGGGVNNVGLLIENQYANSASEIISGLLLTENYRFSIPAGELTAFASGVYILSDRVKDVEWEPGANVVGTIGEPTKWKVSAGIDWQWRSCGLGTRINAISGAENVLPTPSQSVSGWTTVDLTLKYDIPYDSPVWRGVSVGLAIQNIFDRRPPVVVVPTEDASIGRPTIPFDGTNASALGRFLELSLRKRW